MSKRTVGKKRIEVFNLEFLNEHKDRTQWSSSSSNEESILDSKFEVLWSREKKEIFSENDFFKGFYDSLSDLTDQSNSSCSWHYDDFDMNSSLKVKLSLEAIEDALFEQKQSLLISKTVFQECCEWANKFSYFRLKGEQVVEPIDNKAELYSVENEQKSHSGHSASNLQIQGVKMAIQVPEKHRDKSQCIKGFNNLDGESKYFNDNSGEECFASSTRNVNEQNSMPVSKNEAPTIEFIEAVQEKIIEKIALEIWPKVLSILQKTNRSYIPDVFEDFQLPPIVAAVQQRKIAQQRPKTEGTHPSLTDFPKLSSILTISPKVLQNKQDSGSRSSRPNSEIHRSLRNYTVPIPRRKHEISKVFHNVPMFNKNQQDTISILKQISKNEKDCLSTSSLLPALEEDIPVSYSILKGLSLEPEFKSMPFTRSKTVHLSKKSESFLPPIERKSPVPANMKLTRNLFKFFGTPTKYNKHERTVSTIQPTSRPYSSVSRKSVKFSGDVNNKLSDECSSMKKTNFAGIKKGTENNTCKQVMLFPIVTSLIADKERNVTSANRGLNTFAYGKKR